MSEPAIEHPTDVIVETRLTAICGSDLHVYLGRERGNDPGTPMGHEFVGEVVAVGSDVRTVRVGDMVVSAFTTSCGRCYYCRSGLTCRCDQGQLFGWVSDGVGLPGAQAELVRVPLADGTLMKLPEGVELEHALFLGDILATGYFCAEMAGIEPDGTYVIVGCGPVGLLAVVGAREQGARHLFAIDRVPERLAIAAELGATPIASGEDAPGTIADHTAGRGADGVLEVVGSPEASRLALDLVRPGGTVAAVGVHTEAHFAFSPGEAYDKNLTYRAGRCPARRYMSQLLPLVQERKYDLSRIVSHRLPLDDGPTGYELFDQKPQSCTKVILKP